MFLKIKIKSLVFKVKITGKMQIRFGLFLNFVISFRDKKQIKKGKLN